MNRASAKRAAARAAVERLPNSGTIGLGSGTTAELFIEEVSRLIGSGRDLVGVPTSEQSRRLAESLGVPLLGDDGPWDILITVDGADEVSRDLDLIKGGGGCHTREKIVNAASRVNLIIVDESKLSEQLGEQWPVPVEVLPFGNANTRRALLQFGETQLRQKNGTPFRTDAGNYLYDVQTGPLSDPKSVHAAMLQIPGVVETGLFLERADIVLVAGSDGVRTLTR